MMLLTGYRKEIFRPKCNPSFLSVHCIAHLDDDVGAVLPYLNAALGGHEYIDEPRSVTFRVHGKLITVHARQIAINALKDETEGDKILAWLKQEINDAWDRRSEIEPRYEGMPKPRMMEVLKLLPRTNCGECGTPTCTVFAVEVCEGVKDPADCPPLTRERAAAIEEYLNGFDMKALGWD
jgi:ArsR family metal-binding transcriptional regulator